MPTSLLKQHSYVLPFLQKMNPESLGLHRLFNRYEYSEQEVITLGQYSRHYLAMSELPKESEYVTKSVPGEAEFTSFQVPMYGDEVRVTEQMLNKQIAHESFLPQPLSRKTREQWYIADGIKEATKKAIRSLEKQASSILMRGKIGFEYAPDIDLKRDPRNTLVISKRWNDPTADIYGDLSALVMQIRKNNGRPDMVILGIEAWNALFTNEKIQKLLDLRNINIGSITPKMTASGMLHACTLNIHGSILPFFIYDAFYEELDKNGQHIKKNYIDPNAVIMLDSSQELYTYVCKSPIKEQYLLARIPMDNLFFDSYLYSVPPSATVVGVKMRSLLFPISPNQTAVLMANGTKVE